MLPRRPLSQARGDRTREIIGVDGAPGGWVAATREKVEGHATFRELLRAHPRGVFFVDMPIGLLAARAGSGDRPCDKEARAALAARRGSVFVPPRRDQLALADEPYRAGLGIAAQTHGILRKIREVDTHRRDPRIREAHPELAFLLANEGEPLPPKRTSAGRQARGRVLRDVGVRFNATGLGVRATRADVDDAAILVWLGEQAMAGRVGHFGAEPLVIWGRRLDHAPEGEAPMR